MTIITETRVKLMFSLSFCIYGVVNITVIIGCAPVSRDDSHRLVL